MFNVSDKVTFITGGTAGIGLAAAKRLVAAGAQVMISGRRSNGGETAADIGAHFTPLDVTDERELAGALQATRELLGPIDILFNNAGIENTGPLITEAGTDEFQRLLEVNVEAAYNVLHLGAAYLADGASVINTASAAAHVSLPGYSQYAASKAAVVSLTKSAALEFGSRGIRVNAICPGSVWTEMLPQGHPEADLVQVLSPAGRVGEADEVAALVHFLASDDSRYISGAIIPVDGGLLAGYSEALIGALASMQE